MTEDSKRKLDKMKEAVLAMTTMACDTERAIRRLLSITPERKGDTMRSASGRHG